LRVTCRAVADRGWLVGEHTAGRFSRPGITHLQLYVFRVILIGFRPVSCGNFEPIAVGDVLPDMPLLLSPSQHILVPLESTYQATWEATPEEFRPTIGERLGEVEVIERIA